jgi:protein-tyrosine phosphatase
MLSLLDRGVTYIHRQLVRGDRVLVHCYAGKQRSPAVITAYIIKYCEWPVDKALAVVGKLWNNVYPDHYLDALTAFKIKTKTKTNEPLKTNEPPKTNEPVHP